MMNEKCYILKSSPSLKAFAPSNSRVRQDYCKERSKKLSFVRCEQLASHIPNLQWERARLVELIHQIPFDCFTAVFIMGAH